MNLGSITFEPRHPQCQCPTGGYWSVIPPYCPIHNAAKSYSLPAVTTTTTTGTHSFIKRKAKPSGDAMRPEDC